MVRLPENDLELLACGEWAKQLVLSVGGQPETAFAVAWEWTKGLRALMEKAESDRRYEQNKGTVPART